MFEDVVSPDQMVVQGDKVVDRDVDQLIVLLITVWLLLPIDFHIHLFVFKVECLILLVQVLLEELLREVSREAEIEERVDDTG